MCQIGSIDGCGTNEMCVQTKSGRPDGVCQCLPGFGRINKECVGEHPTPPTTPGTLPTASPHTNGPKKRNLILAILTMWLYIHKAHFFFCTKVKTFRAEILIQNKMFATIPICIFNFPGVKILENLILFLSFCAVFKCLIIKTIIINNILFGSFYQ